MYPQIFSNRIMMMSGKINNQRTSGWQVNRKKGGDDIRKQHFFVVAIWPNLGEEKKTNKNFEIKSTHINSHYDLHFHPFYFNSPSSSRFIKNSLKSFAYVNLISLLLLILHSYACNITVFWIEWCIHHLYTCMDPEMLSRSLRISWSILVPKMFLSVVWARRRVEWCAFSTFATETVAFDTR